MSNQGNGGRYSKFQLRLRNIRLSRSKKAQFLKENESYVQEKLQEIRKVVGGESVRVTRRVHVISKENKVLKIKESSIDLKKSSKNKKDELNKLVTERSCSINNTSKVKGDLELEKISEKDSVVQDEIIEKVQEIREKKPKLTSSRRGYSYQGKRIVRNVGSNLDKKELLDSLGRDIILKIKGQFEDNLDELEVLMSELYFLDKTQENEVELKKVKEIKKEINQLIDKINGIIEQYNLYKKNYYIDDIIGIDDNELVDDIISYRTLLDSVSLEKGFVRQYKALDEFKDLSHKLDVIRNQTISLQEENEQRIHEFDIRDKKYDQMKLDIVNAEDIMKKCDLEIKRQNRYMDDLMSKIHKIDEKEYTTYHLRGIQELVGQSLRYLGFLMLSPLGGLLPGIAVQTLATKKMIGNVYKNLHMEEVKHVSYEVIDYDREISHKLTDIDYTSVMIEDTIQDIKKLKDDFMLHYDSRIPGYEDTLRKIDKIQHHVMRSQNKVEKIRERLKTSKKINEKKMGRVKRLNGY